ncbi:hypothetical protein PENSPDRAFT_759009 [Peniophora sp. CONT]|nr:hypothetical protein PENSPDRAFT_759009 [Peniophora sp. CONT]
MRFEYLASAASFLGLSQPTWSICTHDHSGQSSPCRCSNSHLRYTVLRGEPPDGIGRLPTEVITEVFVHALSCYTSVEGAPDRILWKLIDSAFDIMGVCSRWRAILIKAPVFSHTVWNNIPRSAMSLDLVDLFMQRSRQQTISLNMSLLPDRSDIYWMTLRKLEVAHQRIGALRISNWRGQTQDAFPKSIKSLPRLHTLILEASTNCRLDEHNRYCNDIIDKKNLGSHRLPSLRILRIFSHTHILPTIMAPKLQDLHLSCVRHSLDLAETLSHLPHLRVLEIGRLYDPHDTYDNLPLYGLNMAFEEDVRKPILIELEELEVFTVRQAGGVALNTLLACLIIPESAIVSLGCYIDSERDRAVWSDLAQAATRHLRSDGDFAITAVHIQARWPLANDGAILIRTHTDDAPDVEDYNSKRFTLQVRSRGRLTQPNVLSHSDVLVEVVRRIPSVAVTTLCIRSTDLAPRKGAFVDLAFPAVFACFPNISLLEVWGNIAPALYALSLPHPDFPDSTILNELRELDVHDSSAQTQSRIPELQQLMFILWEVRAHLGAAPVRVQQSVSELLDFADDSVTFAANESLVQVRARMQRLVKSLATRRNPAKFTKPTDLSVSFSEHVEVIPRR